MDEKLSGLELQVRQLVELCAQLRKTNTDLRQRLASSFDDTSKLHGRVSEARVRLEALLEQIPESSE
jgi:regulator of replication initiation timing